MAAARGYWRSTRRLALWALLLWCLVALVAPMAAQPLEAISVQGIPLGYYANAQGLPIALVILAFLFAYRQRRIDGLQLYGEVRPPGASSKQPPARKGGLAGMTGALAMAGDWLSGATMVTLAGALYAFGHDGLYWLVGLLAGIALGGMLIAPHLHRAGGAGIVDFIAQRFGGATGALALFIAALATALLLAANAQALLVGAELLLPGVPFAQQAALLAAVLAFLAAAAIGSLARGVTLAQAIAYPLLFAALSLPVVVTATGFVPGQFTFGDVLGKIGRAELGLLEKEFADPVTLKLFTRPFTTATASSGLLLTLSLALGLAAMPHVLRRPAEARSFEGARLMPAAALLLCLFAALAMPPLAAEARLGTLSLAGERTDTPAPRLVQLGRMGLVEVCGVRAETAEALREACAALPDAPAALRLDDIAVPRDRAFLAAPVLAGQPEITARIAAAALVAAALLASCWLGASLAGRSATASNAAHVANRPARLALATLAAAAAVAIVLLRTADVMTLLASGLAIAAAGLAPVLLAGIWTLRATAAGALVGMLAGVAVTVYYIVATRYFAPAFYELWSPLSSAGYGAIADYEAAKEGLAQLAPGDDDKAARSAVAEAARAVANWWGLRDVAAGAPGAAVAVLVTGLVSLVTPRPGDRAISVLSRVRGLAPRG